MTMRALALGTLVLLALPACAGQDPAPEDIGSAASAAAVAKLYASEGALDLIVETLGAFETRDGVRAVVVRGTANRYLKDVLSFVPDDAFCEANIISERRFEIVIHEGHELNTVLSGLPLFVAIDTFTGSPNHYVARIDFGARFYDFLGSSSVWISEEVSPAYVINNIDNISYRGRVEAPAASLSVTAPDGVPAVTPIGADAFRLDWSYAALKDAADPHTTPLKFSAAQGGGASASKTARLAVRAVGLGLTAGDPYEVWPTPACEASVFACVEEQPANATDFGACGSYRQVARCKYASACDVLPAEPLSLTPADASSLEPARVAWNQGSNGGAWHSLDDLAAFTTPACPAEATSIQAVVEELPALTQDQTLPEDGTFTDRAGLAQSAFFGQGYGDGAALLAAIDAYAGGGAIQAWLYTGEVSCHNCHDFAARAVLFYPDSGKVIVLNGHHGYDS